LVLKADKTFVLVVLSAVLKFDSKKLKKFLNVKSLRFAELTEVKSLTVKVSLILGVFKWGSSSFWITI